MPATATEVLTIAASQLGQAEQPNGSNHTKFSEWYYGVHAAWCAMFVSWCFWSAGMPQPASTPKGYAWCSAGSEWYRSRGQLRPGSAGIRRGDVAFFEWGSTAGGYDHVGLVESVDVAAGTVTLIEGNVGNRVQRIRRSLATGGIHSHARPNYATAPEPPAPPPRPPGQTIDPRWQHFRPAETRSLRRQSPMMRGADVRELQFTANLVVADANTPGAAAKWVQVDGVFGQRTDQLVRLVQTYAKAAGEYPGAVDGIAGPATREAIEATLKRKGWWK